VRRFRLLALLLPLLSAARAIGQGDPRQDPNRNPSLERPPRYVESAAAEAALVPAAPEQAWGNQTGATFIAASQFTLKLSTASPDLDYVSAHFYAGSGRYFAQLTVDPGLVISHITCYFNDDHATDNVRFTWQRYIIDLPAGSISSVALDSVSSSGTPGIGFAHLIPQFGPETMHVLVGSGGILDPVMNYIAVDLTPNVTFMGCNAIWRREVPPGPTQANFSDVPSSHPYFKFVEALVETGLTSGCGGGLFCVNSPITRGEMAVFLAAALGLGSSNF
jgi:hypothetical protein